MFMAVRIKRKKYFEWLEDYRLSFICTGSDVRRVAFNCHIKWMWIVGTQNHNDINYLIHSDIIFINNYTVSR